MKKHKLPTGYLFVDEYSKGELETLSIGDYGKPVNVKADFLGLTDPINGVPNTVCRPLQEKWVITLSTQYGCRMKCTFCDVPNVDWRGNASVSDLRRQFYSALRLFPNVKYTERLNIHFARMGEPIFNRAVFEFAQYLQEYKGSEVYSRSGGLRIETLHPVLTTSLPGNFKHLEDRLAEWCFIKNHTYNGQAGLQFSINSTNEEQRREMFGGMSINLATFAIIGNALPRPVGRKYCLNFAYSTDFEIDAKLLRSMFDPEKFMIKITPIHNNTACRENGIKTVGGYEEFTPYADVEAACVAAGFDTLVFVPSMDEEDGLVTCGNAILGGSELKVDNPDHKIIGV